MLHAKKIIAVFIFVFSVQLLSAQSNYITHTLKQGESLSELAQQYNTSVGDIMRLNGMHADTKLVYGSKIKIPSTKTQADAVKKSTTTTTSIKTEPVTTPANEITHIVAKGETLYSISKKYNISVDQIKAWNHLTDENIKLGTLLVISENGGNKPAAAPVQKQSVETVDATAQNEPAANAVTTAQDVTPDSNTKTQPVIPAANNINASVAEQPVTDYSGQGYFASEFKEKKKKNMQDIPGISKTFKTASGWTDGKYYILADNIEPGTIVKITADNGSAVYAKVLWNMGDMKENAGINFRVSNATAAALHEDESSFNVSVSF